MVNQNPPPLHRVSLREQLTQRLEEMILRGEIAAGDMLPSERDMVEQWGVSRSVVRDAIRTLESKGLVTVQHGVGATVKHDVRETLVNSLELLVELHAYRISELLELRVMLESEAARLAAQRATPEDLEGMDRALQAHLQAIREGDLSRVAEADRQFHLCLIRASHNRPLLDLLAPLVRLLLQKTVRAIRERCSVYESDNTKHRKVYESIKAGDDEAAAEWIRITFLDSLETFRLLDNEALNRGQGENQVRQESVTTDLGEEV
mgnify:CR=1 FL=1